MKTRITGGKLKGMVLTSPKSETLRPTLQMVRLAICSMFGNEKFNNIHMLDLYSGTGALGLEALSRGAKFVDFVEKVRTCRQGYSLCPTVVHCSAGMYYNYCLNF